jgi:predicted Zn-dependent protease with MMP-like domain
MILRRESLDDILDRIEGLYDAGELQKARKELRRARGRFRGDPTLLEWEATFANDEGRFEEALSHLDDVLRSEPDRPFARRERTVSLMGLGRFAEALALLDRIGPEGPRDAAHHYDRALCLDRLSRPEEADRAFRKASRIEPDDFPVPLRLPADDFDRVAREAVDETPAELHRYIENVIVESMDYPVSPPLEPGLDPTLLGLYVGVPRTERTQASRDNLDRIFIFKRNLEIEFPDLPTLREEIRRTVIHEVAHHFGFGEDDMGDFA